ncbi:hypothetical protein [Helicobacter cetorum]|uniref:Periplasmic competence protein n=1 Tax=Helicobacter cetorum (strain ATCC BAA-429 / MIT 00-7128) TaxID=182217 RepID=I0EKT6_HELC0|nr:hypothetical protein [Helicobacter cetorum]AFI03555.1 hypothetical protein HCW_01330 [Helicobacter cetorum MIT 00-7128]
MKNFFYILLFFTNSLKALIIETLEEIKTSPKQGTFKAKIIDSNENHQVLGTYKISSNGKIIFTITHIHTLNTYKPFDEKTSLQTTLNPKRSIIPKGTQIILSSKEFKNHHINSFNSFSKPSLPKARQNFNPAPSQTYSNFSYLEIPNKLRQINSKNSSSKTLNTLAEVKHQTNVKEPLKSSLNENLISKPSNKQENIISKQVVAPSLEETTPNEFETIEPKDPNLKEFACGKWVYEDEKLQAIRPSILKRFDEEKETYTDITPCDYSTTQGKTGKIIMPYTKITQKINEPLEEPETFESTRNFSILKAQSSISKCKGARTKKDGTIRQCYFIDEPLKQSWESQYQITSQLIKVVYERPKQDDQIEPTFYETSELAYTSTRKSEVTHNELNLSDKFMGFVEVYEGHYLNDILKETSEYKEWVKEHVRLKDGVCEMLEIEELPRAKSVPLSVDNSRVNCIKKGNYIF